MKIPINTDLLREPALHYLTHGYYTDAPEGTKDWFDFWDEEIRRINEGYSVGGFRITGRHYFYLNYCRILRVDDQLEIAGRRTARKIESFPAFWDGDYNYFWTVDIAQNGISEEDYKKLDLDVKINTLEGGKHIIVIKARGKGYSYKAGAMCTQNMVIGRNQKSYAFAEEKEFLIKDGVLNKAWDNLAFINDHAAFGQPLLKDTDMHKITGYKKVIKTGDVVLGSKNELMGVTIKNDPNKARGKRGILGLFEEAGKCPGLLKAWEVSKSSFGEGAVKTGLMIAYGTGGTDEADYSGLEELFHHPDAHDCIELENIWDDGGTGTICGYFVPAYQNYEGFMTPNGESDIEGATNYLLNEREKKKRSKDNAALEQSICENPLNPAEATLQIHANLFPTAEILMHKNQVEMNRLWQGMPWGTLVKNEDTVKFVPSSSRKPILKFPLRRGDDERGLITILEAPVRVAGDIPNGMYLIGHDPYAHDKVQGGSLGAAYVIKRASPVSHTYPECIVASWVGRPSTQDEYNEQLFLLAEYYNAKIGFENDRGEVIAYAKRFNRLKYLQEEFQMLDNRDLQSKTTTRAYGMHMTPARKEQGEIYIRDWLNTRITTLEDGTEYKVLHTIRDPALLEELLKFNHKKGNFDRVMALMLAIYHQKEMTGTKVSPRERAVHAEFFQRQFFA